MKTIKKYSVQILSVLMFLVLGLTVIGAVLFDRSVVGAEEGISNDSLFTSNADLTVSYGVKDDQGVSGVSLKIDGLRDRDKTIVGYNSYIAKEEIGGALMRFSVLPSAVGVQDFGYMVVTITDSVDPTQQLSFAMGPQTSGWWTIFTASWVAFTDELVPATKASTNNQPVLQLEGTFQNAVARNGFLETFHPSWTGWYMDTGARMSKNGYFTRDTAETKMSTIRLAFDGTNVWMNAGVIASLSDPDFLTAASAALAGTRFESRYTTEYIENLFSSEYCTMQFAFLNPLTDSTTIHISQIGEKLFGGDSAEDYTLPRFLMDKEKESVCGYPYEIPSYSVSDKREGDLTDSATLTILNEKGEEVAYSGNEVNFTKAGKYIFRLSAQVNGVSYSKDFPLTCYAEMPKTNFKLEGGFESSYSTGERIVLNSFQAISDVNCVNDGYADAAVVVHVNGETLASYSSEDTVSYLLEEAGEYSINYIAQNVYGVYDVISYHFTVTETVAFENYKLPVAFRAGQTNRLSDFDIVNYVDGVAEDQLYRAIYVNGEEVYLAQGETVLSGALEVADLEEGSVTLTYKAGFEREDLAYEKNFSVPVIETNYAEDWFVVYDEAGNLSESVGSFVDNEQKLAFNATADSTLVFGNYLATRDFSLLFGVGAASGSFESLTLILQNPMDESEYVELELLPYSDAKSRIFVNGSAVGLVDGSLTSEANGFNWSFSEDISKVLANDGSVVVSYDSWANGTAFDGFEDGSLILKFVFDGVAAGKSVPFGLTKISNQNFFTSFINDEKQTFVDVTAPVIYTYGEFKTGERGYNSTFVVPQATAYDVLKTNVNIKLRVLSPSGSGTVINDLNKTNSVVLNEYGDWMFILTADDGNSSNMAERRVIVSVKDKIAPELTVNGDIYAQYKLGVEHTFPSATASDNNTKNGRVYLIVIYEIELRNSAKDFKYTFTKAGKYKLVYYALDDSFNATKIIYEVTVK